LKEKANAAIMLEEEDKLADAVQDEQKEIIANI
jgi:hypothetical protein